VCSSDLFSSSSLVELIKPAIILMMAPVPLVGSMIKAILWILTPLRAVSFCLIEAV
jgi:hypothetical protein